MEMNITELRRQMLSLIDHLPGEGIVITRRGQPVAEIRPIAKPGKEKRVVSPLIPATGRKGTVMLTSENCHDFLFG